MKDSSPSLSPTTAAVHTLWRRNGLLAIGLLALLCYAVLLGFWLKIAHDRETEFAARNLENLARVLEGRVHGTVDKIDTVLLATQLRLNEAFHGEHHDRPAIDAALARYLALIEAESQSLRVADASGRFIHDASGRLATARIDDRDYFLRNRDDPHAGLVISAPLFARITHNWVITLSRRIDGPGGRFAGLVQAAARADYFQQVFARLNLGPAQSVTLIDDQRRLIARYPAAPERLGKVLESENLRQLIDSGERQISYTRPSAIDGIERLYVVRRVGNQPLYLLVGHAEADYLSNWQRQLLGGLLSIVLLGGVLAGWVRIWLRTYDRAREIASDMTRAHAATLQRTRALLDSLPDPAWLSDRQHRLIAVNDAYAALAGLPASAILDRQVAEIWPSAAARTLGALDLAALDEQQQIRRKGSQSLADGSTRYFDYIATPVVDDAGQLVGVAGVARDITQLHEDRERIRHLAEHDQLTGLPNRGQLAAHVQDALSGAGGRPPEMALFFLDLDHFKNINDTLGHEIGDRLLLQAAHRLRTRLDWRDVISRQGGDEFVVLLRDYGTPARLAGIAQRLIDTLSRPFDVDGHELRVGVSIGISTYPQDGDNLGGLLKSADTAMYQAKATGGNTYRFFTQEMNARISERVALENNLRRALQNGEIHLHYQPQIDIGQRRLTGFEALARWRHPTLGDIPPGRFIPIAEESKLINPIGEWVLREACRQNRAWQDAGLPPVVVAVNLSAVQLRQPELVEQVAAILAETGLDAHWLELEITETAFIRDTERIIGILGQLKALGIKLSVDDFGTGYSSLSYLKRLPFDQLKIDQSFVRELPDDPDDTAIVRAIVAIAVSLQKEVIAEGVEQSPQMEFLRQAGCHLMQGYHFGRPVAPGQAETLLRHPENLFAGH